MCQLLRQDQQQEIEEIERLQGELQKQEALHFIHNVSAGFRSCIIIEIWRHPLAWQPFTQLATQTNARTHAGHLSVPTTACSHACSHSSRLSILEGAHQEAEAGNCPVAWLGLSCWGALWVVETTLQSSAASDRIETANLPNDLDHAAEDEDESLWRKFFFRQRARNLPRSSRPMCQARITDTCTDSEPSGSVRLDSSVACSRRCDACWCVALSNFR